jgi:hypothetical protein
VCYPLTSITSVSATLAPLCGQPGGREVHFEAHLGAVVAVVRGPFVVRRQINILP